MAKNDGGREIAIALKKELDSIAQGINKKDAEDIGQAVIDEMKSMISKGISPIEGEGRFPEYKVKTKVKEIRNAAKELAGVSRNLKKYLRTGKGSQYERQTIDRHAKENQVAAKGLRKRASADQNKGYPYSVKKDFPSKRPRPVNLFLSGKFLSFLNKFISPTAEGYKIEIGFDEKDDKLSSLKESGHREGVHDQPKRPIIPNDSERFAQRIQQVIQKVFAEKVVKFLKSRSR